MKKLLHILYFSKTNGFSIVESLVAISIVTLSITSASSIVQASLQNTSLIKARSIASGLAYESVEIVRNMRDSNNLAGNDFTEGDFATFVQACSNGCALDSLSSSSVYTVCNGDCPAVQKTNTGYTLSGGVETPFVRTVTTRYNQVQGEDAEVAVDIEVSYRSSGRTESIMLESYLLDTF